MGAKVRNWDIANSKVIDKEILGNKQPLPESTMKTFDNDTRNPTVHLTKDVFVILDVSIAQCFVGSRVAVGQRLADNAIF